MLKKHDLDRSLDRRTFLKTVGVLGVAAVGGSALFKTVRLRSGLTSVSQTRVAMGTVVTMTVVDESRDRAQEAIGLAFEEIDRLVRVLSRHDSATPLSVLNEDGRLNEAPSELIEVIEHAVGFYRLSDGAFDATVKPIIDLHERRAFDTMPGARARSLYEDAVERVGSDKISVTGRRVWFERDGMGITLDGIAKGYVVDRASRVLRSSGACGHLINAGGDIAVTGKPADRPAWRIAVRDPANRRPVSEIIELNNGAVATSGDYEVFYDEEKIHHHVIDPRTGSSARTGHSVTVTTGSVMRADALSTAVFVMGPDAGIRFVDMLAGAECLVIGDDGTRGSAGWQREA